MVTIVPLSRTLIRALAASALIHAVLLAGVIHLLPPRLEAPAVSVRAKMNGNVRETTSRRNVRQNGPPAIETATTSVPGAPRPMLQRQAAFEASRPAVPHVPHTAMLPDSVPNSASPVSRSARRVSTEEVAGESLAARQEARDGVNADDLRQYRVSLAVAARRFKRYPSLARERGWEGTVDVAVTILSHRSQLEVSMLRSSGHALLDEQALEMLRHAAGVTVLPSGLQGRDFRMVLPVRFSLDAEP